MTPALASTNPSRCFPKPPEQQLLGPGHALELQRLHALLHPAIERKADLPGPCENLRVLDRGFVHQVIRTDRGVPLDDVKRVAVIVARAIEPRLLALSCDVDHERVALPASARP